MSDKLVDLVIGPHGWPDTAIKTLRSFKLRKGIWINKGQLVAVVETKLEGQEKAITWRIKAQNSGKVTELLLKPGDPISDKSVLARLSTECSHPTLMKDMCADCGADLRQDESNTVASSSSTASVAMVHSIPELKVSSAEAETLGREDEMRLRKNKKLVLLVDLDQTLIHTTNENVRPNIKNVHHFQLYGPNSPWYHTRIRPFTEDFLEKISKLYELHICTFGARLYAHTIANILDPKSQYFSHRILSRDECFDNRSKTANLSSLFPCGDHMVCIIDDREDVWKFAPNLVHVKPYVFFKNTGDINAPPGSKDELIEASSGEEKSENEEKKPVDAKDNNKADQNKSNEDKGTEDKEDTVDDSHNQIDDDLQLTDDDDDDSDFEEKDQPENKNEKSTLDKKEDQEEEEEDEKSIENDLIDVEDKDDYLIYLEEVLTTIHKAYYDLHQQMKDQGKKKAPDLKTVIPYVKRKVLQGTNLVFSGVVPTHIPLQKSKAYMLAKSLGANVTKDIVKTGKDQTSHLIAARLGTAKVNEAKRVGGLHVVTPNWLWMCAERWEKVEERLFPLSTKAPIVLKPPAHCSSPEIAFAERCGDFDLNMAQKMPFDNNSSLPEAIKNPLLSFSSEDIKGMDKELDDILSDDSSSSSDNEEGNFPPKRKHEDSSSSEESLDAEVPKGWEKRKKDDDSEEESDMDQEDDGEDELSSMAKELEKGFMDEN